MCGARVFIKWPHRQRVKSVKKERTTPAVQNFPCLESLKASSLYASVLESSTRLEKEHRTCTNFNTILTFLDSNFRHLTECFRNKKLIVKCLFRFYFFDGLSLALMRHGLCEFSFIKASVRKGFQSRVRVFSGVP